MVLPPLFGAVQLTVAETLPATAVTPDGAAGFCGRVGAVTVTDLVTAMLVEFEMVRRALHAQVA